MDTDGWLIYMLKLLPSIGDINQIPWYTTFDIVIWDYFKIVSACELKIHSPVWWIIDMLYFLVWYSLIHYYQYTPVILEWINGSSSHPVQVFHLSLCVSLLWYYQDYPTLQNHQVNSLTYHGRYKTFDPIWYWSRPKNKYCIMYSTSI